jgi:hypothetical protein
MLALQPDRVIQRLRARTRAESERGASPWRRTAIGADPARRLGRPGNQASHLQAPPTLVRIRDRLADSDTPPGTHTHNPLRVTR